MALRIEYKNINTIKRKDPYEALFRAAQNGQR
jgi:hypothetical protein